MTDEPQEVGEELVASLARLVAASRALEAALLRSDIASVERATAEMETALNGVDQLLTRGRAPLKGGDVSADTDDVEPPQERLNELLRALREQQERNAQLVLGALRLRRQWRQLLAALMPATYGPDGTAELRPGRQLLSRKA